MEQGITVVITGATTSVIIERLKANLAGFQGAAAKTGAPENKNARAAKPKVETEIEEDDLVNDEELDLDDAPEEAEETGPTFQDARQALLNLGKKKGADKAKALMSEFNCKSMAEVEKRPKQFAAIIAKAKKLTK